MGARSSKRGDSPFERRMISLLCWGDTPVLSHTLSKLCLQRVESEGMGWDFPPPNVNENREQCKEGVWKG